MLKKEITRAILLDWIEKDGRAKGDTDPWIDVIAEATLQGFVQSQPQN